MEGKGFYFQQNGSGAFYFQILCKVGLLNVYQSF